MIHESEQAAVLNAAFDSTNIKFYDRSVALAALKADGREVVFTDDGTARIHYDGEQLDLADALTRLGFDRRELIDGRTLPREGAGTARQGTLSKADFPDVQSRVKFIRENGAEAWEKLPTVNHDTKPVTTREDWYKLSRAEKVRRIASDPHAFSKLPAAPSAANPVTKLEQVAPGTQVNRAALEHEKKIRGGR